MIIPDPMATKKNILLTRGAIRDHHSDMEDLERAFDWMRDKQLENPEGMEVEIDEEIGDQMFAIYGEDLFENIEKGRYDEVVQKISFNDYSSVSRTLSRVQSTHGYSAAKTYLDDMEEHLKNKLKDDLDKKLERLN